MARIERHHPAEPSVLTVLRTTRTDIVQEEPEGHDQWSMVKGPFSDYSRRLTFSTDGDTVTETTEFKLAIPLWWVYLILLFRRALADLDRRPRKRFWWPREVVDADTSRLMGAVGTIGAMAGYMGVLIGQTITFAAEDFGVSDSGQANTLAATRVGVLVSMVLLGRADRIGRRPLTLGFAVAAVFFTSLGAVAPNMAVLGATQTLSRGLTTGLLTLVTLAATEEAPASARAIAIGFATLATGFGAALVVWIIPVADLFDGGWRVAYAVPVLFIPLLLWLSRRLPETRRYTVANRHDTAADINWRRFALIAFAAFAAAVYLSPASQLRNEFLRDDLGFAAIDVSMFQILISVPATLAVPLGGYLVDRFGRKLVGATTLGVGVVASALSYQTSGPSLWILSTIAMSSSAAAVPALRGYQTELFPTRARGRVGGMIDAITVTGSAFGLVIVGQLAVRWDDLGSAIGVMVFGPLLVVLLVLTLFPETADQELEVFNPGDIPMTDALPPPGVTSVAPVEDAPESQDRSDTKAIRGRPSRP